MATLATFFRRPLSLSRPVDDAPVRAVQVDPYRLRDLPNEDVFFYSKRIDNSRVVREADPKARERCWSIVGAASVLAALLITALAPTVGSTLAGYKLQTLRQEQQRLMDERRVLEVE